MNVTTYQKTVYSRLQKFFGDGLVKKEWDVAKDGKDDFTRELYCPRLDVAVGPFNIEKELDFSNRIYQTIENYTDFLAKLWQSSEQRNNAPGIIDFIEMNKNKNPRCFLAIEIENSGSSKHMLGNIANTSILGSFGIVIPFNDKKLALCQRLQRYVKFATAVKKVGPVFQNVLIIKKEKFLQLLEESLI